MRIRDSLPLQYKPAARPRVKTRSYEGLLRSAGWGVHPEDAEQDRGRSRGSVLLRMACAHASCACPADVFQRGESVPALGRSAAGAHQPFGHRAEQLAMAVYPTASRIIRKVNKYKVISRYGRLANLVCWRKRYVVPLRRLFLLVLVPIASFMVYAVIRRHHNYCAHNDPLCRRNRPCIACYRELFNGIGPSSS